MFQSLLTLAAAALAQYSPDAVLLRTPDASETHLVFQYSGDLWLAPRAGGPATRLTSAEGTEALPKFSPDGQTIAFMADYDGGTDLYTLPITGGPPRRITFHPGRETLSGWHPSGDSLLYFGSEASGLARAPKIFRVPVAGGSPEPLPVPYGTFCEIDPSGQWLAYTPLSREGRTWRRYRGGMAQDIWLFHLETGESRRVTDDPGTDRMPMWAGAKLLFQSDRGEKGIANLYEYDPASGETKRLTSFTSSGARFPSIGPKDVVFEQGGSLFRYLLDSGEIERVRVTLPGDRPSLRPIPRKLDGAVAHAALSATGKRVWIEARGEVFDVPADEGVTRNATGTAGIAERLPSPSPDGARVAYWSDRSGEYELTVRSASHKAGDGPAERRLTSTGIGWKSAPLWSPDSKRIAWSNQNGELSMVSADAESDQSTQSQPTVIALGHAPSFLAVSWSPDSRWLAWSDKSSRSDLDALFLHEVDSGETHEVTTGLFDDKEPVFSTCGEWLFFHSSRAFSPTYADLDTTWIYRESRTLMAVPLNEDVELPWALVNEVEADSEAGAEAGPEAGAEAGAEARAEASVQTEEDASEGAANDAAKPAVKVQIDLEGFESRVVRLPIEPGIAGGLIGHDGGVFFSRLEGEEPSLFHLTVKAYEDGPKPVIAGATEYSLSADGKKLLVRTEAGLGVIDAAPAQELKQALELNGLRGSFDPRLEWPQMIHDVYRLYRDWFYDETLHGVDWEGERNKALDRLKDATSRADVHFLIGEMLAELNVGHAYNQPPTDVNPRLDGFGRSEGVMPAGLLGADWTPVTGASRKGFRVERVLGAAGETDGRGPLHGKAREGDLLVAVNGRQVDAEKSLHEHLLGRAGRATELTFLRAAGGDEENVLVEPLSSETELRYRDWVSAKRAAVHAASDGAIGYIHVPSTGIDGQNELYRQFLAEHSRKALIIDERWNSGGQIPTRFIELLARRPTNAWATRGRKAFRWPQVAHDGPKAMLINHSAGSGGDAFPWYFRELGLGTLIGTRTWGGLVGISGNPALIDGAAPTVPTFGFFEHDSTWAVEGHGVAPDIEVLDDPGQMREGQDPQLERAMAELKTAMESWPYAALTRPAPPVRTGAGIPESDR